MLLVGLRKKRKEKLKLRTKRRDTGREEAGHHYRLSAWGHHQPLAPKYKLQVQLLLLLHLLLLLLPLLLP